MDSLATTARKMLTDFAPEVNKEIKAILDDEVSRVGNYSPIVFDFLNNMRQLAMGGKKLRGAFAYYSYLMFGGTNPGEMLKVSAAIELVSTFMLIHDDILDKDDLRRGEKTIHKIYRDSAGLQLPKADPLHFGTGMGMLAGDILNFIGIKAFADTTLPAEFKSKALYHFMECFLDCAYGETLDFWKAYIDEFVEAEILQILELKTATYTYRSPLYIGALLAGAHQEELTHLDKYAVPGGIAFQIQDDILGMFGDSEKTGKPADSDLKEGKKTLLISEALTKATPEQKQKILACLGNENITTTDYEEVKQIIIDTGSLSYSKTKAQELVIKAKQAILEKPGWANEGRIFMEGIADYMINREL